MFKLNKEKIMKFISENKPPMTSLGEFVYMRTYSRYLDDEKRREMWNETVLRSTEYIFDIEKKYREENNLPLDEKALEEEAFEFFKNVYMLKQFPSGRTLFAGGSEASYKFPTSNFNCSFIVPESLHDFEDIFYLLMVGSGVGFRTLPRDSEKIERVDKMVRLKVIGKSELYNQGKRLEHTFLDIKGSEAVIMVGDSKEGFVDALKNYFNIVTGEIQGIENITIDLSYIRPKGTVLKTFGGTASGPEPMRRMFIKIGNIIRHSTGKLKTVDLLDIGTIIAENVVSGGVRRSSEMNLSAKKDTLIEKAKSNLYTKNKDGAFVLNEAISHRTNSNNSIFYDKRPSLEDLKEDFDNMRMSGERGFLNAIEAKRRRKDAEGVNPCGEILLPSRGFCNLNTIVLPLFIKKEKGMYVFDKCEALKAFKMAARSAQRINLLKLELPLWEEKKNESPTIGVSFTGYFDMVDAVGFSEDEQRELLREFRKAVRDEAKAFSDELGVKAPELCTTIKPEGTLSQVPTVSSGIHRSHDKQYIRRVRISSDDPLVKAAEKIGIPVFPEVGEDFETATTLVLEFPVKSTATKFKKDVSAIEQLETYKMVMQEYVDHNCSITVHVRNNEWEDALKWTHENWDSVVGISFISYDDSFYQLLPYESISNAEYERRRKNIKEMDMSELCTYVNENSDDEISDSECASGVCPIR